MTQFSRPALFLNEQPMTLKNLIPEQYYKAIEAGEMLLMVATPFDETKEPIRVGFNKHHLFSAKITPTGQSWVSNKPLMDMPKDATTDVILEVIISTIMKMAVPIGGAAIDIMLADIDNTTNN